jgi:ketosteroid isomerase-like protein
MAIDEQRLQRLLDRIEIEDLARRYSHAIDARDWPGVDACFSPNATVVGTTSQGPYPEYIKNLRPSVESFKTTMHFLGDQVVTVEGDRGSVTTYGVAFHLGATPPGEDFVIGVHYVDQVGREDGVWRITQRFVKAIWRKSLGDVQTF